MMSFSIDKQTLEDLELFSRSKNQPSVFRFFTDVRTHGGKLALLGMMQSPSNDADFLRKRVELIRFVHNRHLTLPFIPGEVDHLESYYLPLHTPPLHDNLIDAAVDWFWSLVKPNNNYYLAFRGVHFVRNLVQILHDFCHEIEPGFPGYFLNLKHDIEGLLHQKVFRQLAGYKRRLISFRQINHFDYLLRSKGKEEIRKLLDYVYQIDAIESVARTATNRHLAFPEFFAGDTTELEIDQLFHPFLEKPVLNDIRIGKEENMCFITGPNMAGKSTFLKAVGLCIYLAHIGFPVPAKSMKTSVFNGLSITINLRDELSLGYSHFYSEVQRVKEAATSIRDQQRMVVIFDELFRGTNVKDAFEGSVEIINALTAIPDSLFFISTHLIEVADKITNPVSVLFRYLDIKMEEDQPLYSYQIKEGISNERLGLLILKREKILELLKPK